MIEVALSDMSFKEMHVKKIYKQLFLYLNTPKLPITFLHQLSKETNHSKFKFNKIYLDTIFFRGFKWVEIPKLNILYIIIINILRFTM